MQIRASVQSSTSAHEVTVSTDGRASVVAIPGRPGGGSALNGGELLCAALATCYCNDLYREAARRGVVVHKVTVEVEAEFGGRGEPARRITYAAQVESDAPAAEIEALLRETDAVAEVLREDLPSDGRQDAQTQLLPLREFSGRQGGPLVAEYVGTPSAAAWWQRWQRWAYHGGDSQGPQGFRPTAGNLLTGGHYVTSLKVAGEGHRCW